MPSTILLSILTHHGEAADPDLLEWIKSRLDHLVDLGPWTIVILLGMLILAIPLSVVGFYIMQRRHSSSETHPG